jgi:nucleoside-diphosphate-sugar epimerase
MTVPPHTYDRVVLTGGAGWLGTGVLQRLCQGGTGETVTPPLFPRARIRVLVLPGQRVQRFSASGCDVEVVEGDLTDPQACVEVCRDMGGGLVIHVAGVIHPRSVGDFHRVNVTGTGVLLEAAVNAGMAKAVVLSSNSPCGCNPHRDHLFDECSPYRPYMGYGRSKMLMEQLVGRMQQQGRLATTVIRAPWFYGPYQPPRQTLFFKMVRDGRAPIVGDGLNRRSMAYIGNLVDGIMLAAASPIADGRTYWIADARPYTMNEIVDTIERLLETEFGTLCRHRRLRLPSFVSEVAWAADSAIQSLGMYHQKIHVLSEMNQTIACSIDRARVELGYEPRVDLEEGMRRSLRWLFATDPRVLDATA